MGVNARCLSWCDRKERGVKCLNVGLKKMGLISSNLIISSSAWVLLHTYLGSWTYHSISMDIRVPERFCIISALGDWSPSGPSIHNELVKSLGCVPVTRKLSIKTDDRDGLDWLRHVGQRLYKNSDNIHTRLKRRLYQEVVKRMSRERTKI